MKLHLQIFLPLPVLSLFFISCGSAATLPEKENTNREKTVFQTAGPWKPVTDIRSDVAIVYGTDDRKEMTFEQRVQSWRDRGYGTHFMTGIAWGNYQDYFTGEWDGEWHLDEGQVTQQGDTLWHGHMVPYLVPTDNFIKYMKEKHIKRVIDADIDAIYLEEPEFWAHAGYSEAFKREWKNYYGFDWKPQHESPENTYLSNKLKYHLYYRALEECFTFAKEYGKSKGMNVRCYVPTHSLINYSQWQIVSPEASLASLDCVDGYIAQVWTGTSREPNYFNGIEKERVFETAFLEYGSMESMTAPTGRKMYFLTDPIEDRLRDWVDFKRNYEATFTAQLLYPNNADFEVMPWPDRIYEGLYRTSPHSDERARIPRHYSTQMQVMINALNEMPVSANKVTGSDGISILMSNSLMFQRFPTHAGYDDPQLANFYGQALPLLKRGIPVKTLHIENVNTKETWNNTDILIMTYSNMKPLDPEVHTHIAAWVKDGGILVYCGRDDDPFQTVREWWNTDGNTYLTPSAHLFEKLGIQSTKEGEYKSGKGIVYIVKQEPKEFILQKNGDSNYIEIIKNLYNSSTSRGNLEIKNNFFLERGPFDMIAVMDESINDAPFIHNGTFIDLFDPNLPVLQSKTVEPGTQAFLLNVERIANKNIPQVIATASRVYDEKRTKNNYSFTTKSPQNTTNVMRILLPSEPNVIEVKTPEGSKIENISGWDTKSKTLLLSFENYPDGVFVNICW